MQGEGGPWAHSRNDEGERHGLVAHLMAVAAMARGFAEPFGGGEMASWAGLWHDLGKFHPDFQDYLWRCDLAKAQGTPPPPRGVDHKGAGTTVAGRLVWPLAFLVAGHHGGLHERGDLQARFATWQGEARVEEALTRARQALGFDPPGKIEPPAWVMRGTGEPERMRRLELFLRMLFSCLVDADFLDTEAHFRPDRAAARLGGAMPSLDALWPVFEAVMAGKTGRWGDATGRAREVGRVRDEVYEACLKAGAAEPGLFRLTVPTGGGKTLAAMAFALRHAEAHGLRRVIVAVPYTSITEQTAAVYRDIFGDDVVLEHHSAVPAAPDPEETDGGPQWSRLAAENWDAPVIVTTTVRLFESLFARTTSACRRLHRVANSVVILDEVQTLPSRLLAPILDGLGELAAHYRTSVVLCTATQPALDDAPGFSGLTGVREIAPEPARLFPALRRVRFEWPREGERWSWARVAEEMRTERQALAVVNTKADALALLDALGEGEDVLHLSTLLCGAHRRDVLDLVRRRLREDEPCLLVSTQVVEAGVDLDFPLVLRAMGPLDRIVQAAGRCNREGRLAEGRVAVFLPEEGGLPPGDYRSGAQVAARMLATDEVRPDDPETFPRYFRSLYRQVELDKEGIQAWRAALDYPETARRFRMIDEDGSGVLVRYRRDAVDTRADELIARARRARGTTRSLLRAAQPFMVAVRERALQRYVAEGLVEAVQPELLLWRPEYHGRRGLIDTRYSPDDLIV